MHGAAFSDEPGAELLKDAVGLDEHFPETIRKLGIVCGVRVIAAEGDRAGDLARKFVDGDVDAESFQFRHDRFIEFSNGTRLEGEPVFAAIAHLDFENLFIEVEDDLERAMPVINRRGRQAARADIKRNMPGMIKPGRQCEPHLAGDLSPEVKRFASLFPRTVR